MAVALLVIGAVLGAVLTLATGLLQDRLRRRWDREQEQLRRAESAGEAILPLLDRIRDALSDAGSLVPNDDEADRHAYAAADEIEQLALRIGNNAVRKRLRDIALAVKRHETVLQWMGHPPDQVGWNARVCGQNAVGALLGVEHLQEPSIISDYVSAISDEDDIYEAQAEREQAERRGRNQALRAEPR